MKQFIFIILVAVLLFTAGCGSSKKKPEVSGSLEDLVNQVYQNSGLELPKTEVTTFICTDPDCDQLYADQQQHLPNPPLIKDNG